MRFGVFGGRADSRGLATLSEEIARHLRPDRILGFDLSSDHRTPPCDWSIYDGPNLDVVPSLKVLTDDLVRSFFADLDLVIMLETDYEPHRKGARTSVLDIARQENCRTVLYAMPELYRWSRDPGPLPDVVYVPTNWEIRRIPGARVLPCPMATDRLPCTIREKVDTVLHIVGTQAMADRAGTELVLAAAPDVHLPITIRTQVPLPIRPGANITVERGKAKRYWEVTDGDDLLLAPRRFAGLSLPLMEAMTRGMPVVTLDREPEKSWVPAKGRVALKVGGSKEVDMLGGRFEVVDAEPEKVVESGNAIIDNERLCQELSRASARWGVAHSWDRLAGKWMDALTGVL